MSTANAIETTGEKQTVWSPTQVQFLYKHKNGWYYVRVFACGKEKWTSLKTKLLSVAKNRMKEHIDAAERQRTTGNSAEAVGRLNRVGQVEDRCVHLSSWQRRASPHR